MSYDERNIYNELEQVISNNAEISEAEKNRMLKMVMNLRREKINIMITGATGCGKSSTINALFDADVAKVGVGVDPETMTIQKYELKNLVLWDSPGLGDGKEADTRHAQNIVKKLQEKDADGNALIDIVLVILDGSSRDLGTSYELINKVIIPNLGEEKERRILVAINQCDMAMKGRGWNQETNEPEPQLERFLADKVSSVKKRIFDSTGINVTPIYYSAGFKDGTEEQHPYNMSKLLYYIIQHTPEKKRLVYVDNVSKKQEVWASNDKEKDYNTEIERSFFGTVAHYVGKGIKVVASAAWDIGTKIISSLFKW